MLVGLVALVVQCYMQATGLLMVMASAMPYMVCCWYGILLIGLGVILYLEGSVHMTY